VYALASTCSATPAKIEKGWTSQGNVLLSVVLPLFAGAFCLNYTIWQDPDMWTLHLCALAGVTVYTLGHFAGWLVSRAKFGQNSKGAPTLWNVFWALPSGMFLGLGVFALNLFTTRWYEDPVKGKWEDVSWGPPLFVLVFLLAGVCMGLAKAALRNEILEWWERLAGWLLLFAFCGSTLA
jgi:hypothetical protein